MVPVFSFMLGCGSDTTTTSTSSTGSSGAGSVSHSIPNDAHFETSPDTFNLDGTITNSQANISVYIADRFGNGNVLTGTKVTFYAESGATESSTATADAKGTATVIFRTQVPGPKSVAISSVANLFNGWRSQNLTEAQIMAALQTDYAGVDTAYHPRNGWGSVLVTVKGEEGFTDTNGSGGYDAGESFTDTIAEPFTDYNDNGQWDTGEYFVDLNANGTWDGAKNGIWDASTVLSREIKLIMSGTPQNILFNRTAPYTDAAFTVSAGNPKKLKVLVADANFNPLLPGTTVVVSATAGVLSDLAINTSRGTSSATGTTKTYTFPKDYLTGPVEIEFSISSGGTLGNGTVTVTVTHKTVTYSKQLTYTVS
ncbi:MAG: Ig-like domain-containing protein [Nitrospinae bacterium]|nr:Ig-like domain-containing protein [Nitrospinota bacterium]